MLNTGGPSADTRWVPPDATATQRPAGADDALRRVLDAAGVAAATLDLEGRLTSVNPAFARACGRLVGELVGLHVLSLCPDGDQAELLAAVVHLVGGAARIERGELRVVGADGTERALRLTLGTSVDDAGTPVAIHAVAEDLTAQRREERLREQAGDQVVSALASAAATGGTYALLLCGLHPGSGDAVVVDRSVDAVVELLAERLRGHDTVCRTAPGRLAVVATGLGDVQDAAGVAYRVLAAVVPPADAGAATGGQLSIGIAVGDDGTAAADLVAAAGTALVDSLADGPGGFRLEDRRTHRA